MGNPKIIVVMPAYNAARTLERTYRDLPANVVDHVILVDDVSQDETVEIARRLGLEVIVHIQYRGYGGNQKTCYIQALKDDADIVVMLHPDNQYNDDSRSRIGPADCRRPRRLVLGSRLLNGELARAGCRSGSMFRTAS